MSEGVVTKQDEIDAAYRLGQRGHHRRHEVLPRLLDPSLALQNRVIERKPNGQYAKGVSGNLGGNAHRSRHALNSDTIREMHAAFRRGGREAIDKVMRTQPAAFLKLLVLLVPREMKVEHRGGVKAMTDEQLEQGIEAIQRMLEARAPGDQAKVIEGTADTVALLAPALKAKRKLRRSDQVAGPPVDTGLHGGPSGQLGAGLRKERNNEIAAKETQHE